MCGCLRKQWTLSDGDKAGFTAVLSVMASLNQHLGTVDTTVGAACERMSDADLPAPSRGL